MSLLTRTNGIGIVHHRVTFFVRKITYKVVITARVRKELAVIAHRMAVVVHEHGQVVKRTQIAVALGTKDRLRPGEGCKEQDDD